MTEVVDTGFGDVAAGEVWTDPAEAKVGLTSEPKPKPIAPRSAPDLQASQHAERLLPSDGIDLGAVPVTTAVSPQPDIPTEKSVAGLTPAGVQAAKALVQLPTLSAPDLAKLAREMAMDIKERHLILSEFNLTQVQYDFLEANNAFFRSALHAACIEWHAPLSTEERIKVEAAAILEDSLPGLGARMQNKGEGLPGVIEAAKLFAKVAGVGERQSGSAGTGERFVINIDLGGDQKITVSTAQAEGPHSQPDFSIQIPEDSQAPVERATLRENGEGSRLPPPVREEP